MGNFQDYWNDCVVRSRCWRNRHVLHDGAQTSGGADRRLRIAQGRTLAPLAHLPQICAVPCGHGRDHFVCVVQIPYAEELLV